MANFEGKHEEVKDDYTLWIDPTFKKELYDISRALNDGRSRTQLVDYIYQSLGETGVREDYIHNELDDLSQDPKYIKAQAKIDEYWDKIRERVEELHRIGIYPSLDTSQGEVLAIKRHSFTRCLITKLLGLWETRVLGSEVITLPIKVFSLHSPRIEGAVCVYSDTDKESSIGVYIIHVFGVGGGGKMETYLQIGADYEARSGSCYKIVKKARIQIERCIELYKGKECEPYLSITPIGLERGYEKIPLVAEEDACQAIGESDVEYVCFDLRGRKIWTNRP